MIDRYQHRGPMSSSDYNEDMLEKVDYIDELAGIVDELASRVSAVESETDIEIASVVGRVNDLEQAVVDLTAGYTDGNFVYGIRPEDVLMDSGLPITPAGVTITNPLEIDSLVNLVTLEQGEAVQKLRFLAIGETVWEKHPDTATASIISRTPDSIIGTTDNAIDPLADTAYITSFSVANTTMKYYVKIPVNGVPTDMSNLITICAAPAFYQRLVSIQYTTDANPTLDESQTWTTFTVELDVHSEDAPFKIPGMLHEAVPVYVQENFATRRYYTADRRLTALRIELTEKRSGGNAVGLDVNGTGNVFLGLRQVDVAHVSFSSTGSLAFEVALPEVATKILTIEPRIVNGENIGTYSPTTTVFYDTGGTWTQVTLGTSGTTVNTSSLRVLLEMDLSNGTSPVIAGWRISYS
jgi:hypothetical protein